MSRANKFKTKMNRTEKNITIRTRSQVKHKHHVGLYTKGVSMTQSDLPAWLVLLFLLTDEFIWCNCGVTKVASIKRWYLMQRIQSKICFTFCFANSVFIKTYTLFRKQTSICPFWWAQRHHGWLRWGRASSSGCSSTREAAAWRARQKKVWWRNLGWSWTVVWHLWILDARKQT